MPGPGDARDTRPAGGSLLDEVSLIVFCRPLPKGTACLRHFQHVCATATRCFLRGEELPRQKVQPERQFRRCRSCRHLSSKKFRMRSNEKSGKARQWGRPEVMGDANDFVRTENCLRVIRAEYRPLHVQADVAEGKKLRRGLLDFVKRLYGSVQPIFRRRRSELEILLQAKVMGWLIVGADRRGAEYDGRQKENDL